MTNKLPAKARTGGGTVSATGLIAAQDIHGPLYQVFIDAIYTAPRFTVFSGQIEINLQESVSRLYIPDSKLAIIVGQGNLWAQNKAGVLTDDISLQCTGTGSLQ